MRTALPADYEVGLEQAVYGPGPGTAVPWSAVAGWAAAHPPERVLGCQVQSGWTFEALRVRGGFAYLLFTPAGRMAKLYLSSTPLAWD